MKKLILLSLLALLSVGHAFAQSETPSDSIRLASPTGVKNFGGFLLDMKLMNMEASQLPKFTLELPNANKDYSNLFRLNTDAIYTQGFSNVFSPSWGTGYGWGLYSSPSYMQMGSFKLKNGMRLNTYGDYNSKGWRVPVPSAMPWEKNNFRGAFELKSQDGSFGIRIEVQQKRGGLY